jgi:nucleoside-diphosphate-sugar epimerase
MQKEMFWGDKNILITGNTGFLGLWFTESLVIQNANFIGKVRDLVSKSRFYHPVILIHGINETQDQYLSAQKAKKVLNWKSQYILIRDLKKQLSGICIFLKYPY